MTIEIILSIIGAAAAVVPLFLPATKNNTDRKTEIKNIDSSIINVDNSTHISNDNRTIHYTQATQINNFHKDIPASTSTKHFPIYVTIALTFFSVLTASYIEQNSWIVILVASFFVFAFAILSYFKSRDMTFTTEKVFILVAFLGLLISRFNFFAPTGFAANVIGLPINLSALVTTSADTLVYLFGKTMSLATYFYCVARCVINIFRKRVSVPVDFKTLARKIIFFAFVFLFTSNLIFALVSTFFN